MDNTPLRIDVNPISWKILSTRIRKDVFKKPSNAAALIGTHWNPDVVKEQLTFILDLTIRDKSDTKPIELGFVSLEVICEMKGVSKLGPNVGFPPEIMIRLGQKACDIAYGVLLAKSVGTGLHGIALPEVPPQAFLPPPESQIFLN
jgi:hypothetical protein